MVCMEFKPLSTHPLFMDLTGKRYGRWLVLGFLGRTKQNGAFKWWCRCDCGIERHVTGDSLAGGRSVSCGCLVHEKRTEEDFKTRNRLYQKKYREKNKEIRAAKLKEWRSKSPEKRYAYNRDYHYRKKYGISHSEAEALLESQNGRCLICNDEINLGGTGGPCIDHNHETHEVRGILCRPCNHGLGCFQEKEEIMLSAIAYLKRRGIR